MKATVFFVVVWIIVPLPIAHSEPLIACSEQHPGEVRPRDWAWRTIDGKPCWYRGPQMMRKDRLYWQLPEPEWIKPGREEPELMLPQEEAKWDQEYRWPVYGKGQ